MIEWTNWPHHDHGNAVISVLQTPDVNFEPCPFDAYYIVRRGGPLPSGAKGTYPWVTPSLMSWTCTTRRTTRSLPLHGVSLSRIPRLLQRFVPLAAGHLRGVEEELRDTLDWCAHGRSCLPAWSVEERLNLIVDHLQREAFIKLLHRLGEARSCHSAKESRLASLNRPTALQSEEKQLRRSTKSVLSHQSGESLQPAEAGAAEEVEPELASRRTRSRARHRWGRIGEKRSLPKGVGQTCEAGEVEPKTGGCKGIVWTSGSCCSWGSPSPCSWWNSSSIPRRVFGDLSISGLSRLGYLCIKKDVYYHNEGDLVGEVEGVRVQEGNIFLDLDATGTKDERLLWAVVGSRAAVFQSMCVDRTGPTPWLMSSRSMGPEVEEQSMAEGLGGANEKRKKEIKRKRTDARRRDERRRQESPRGWRKTWR